MKNIRETNLTLFALLLQTQKFYTIEHVVYSDLKTDVIREMTYHKAIYEENLMNSSSIMVVFTPELIINSIELNEANELKVKQSQCTFESGKGKLINDHLQDLQRIWEFFKIGI